MRAALLVEPGRIVVDDAPKPEPGPDDARVAVAGVGLCGSDLSVFDGTWDAPGYPWIMGHEAFGTIDAVGDDVPTSRVGDLVAIEPNVVCGACDQCRRGRTSGCRQRRSVGMNRAGAIAEFVVVPARNAWVLAPRPAEDLVCVEPLTVVETALRRLQAGVPESALVVGVGGQGSLMCQALQRRGVEVHVTDVSPERVDFAMELGARRLDPAGDRRFDLVVDCAGVPSAVAVSLARAEIGGTILELGLDGRPFELSARSLVRGQLTIQGSLTYDHPQDFAASVALLEDASVHPGRVVTDEYQLADAQEAFERARSARGKTWIRLAPVLVAGRG